MRIIKKNMDYKYRSLAGTSHAIQPKGRIKAAKQPLKQCKKKSDDPPNFFDLNEILYNFTFLIPCIVKLIPDTSVYVNS